MSDFLFWALVIVIALVVLWKFSPKFRSKAGKHVDKDGDGKPFR